LSVRVGSAPIEINTDSMSSAPGLTCEEDAMSVFGRSTCRDQRRSGAASGPSRPGCSRRSLLA
jgi:hypothetical protein